MVDEHLPLIRELHASCKGNRVRVHEELAAQDIHLPYATLTAAMRRAKIGVKTRDPAGTYYAAPGKEMQHDTSPHVAEIAGRLMRVQTASLVLAHSRMLFFQCYPRFTRFYCKAFLTEAARFFQGVASVCIIDNTHVVVLRGTGAEAVMVPEMETFAGRLGFRFVAHEKGDADRSGKVERPFHYIEHNFFAGRTFADWDDLNAQAITWCDRTNGTYRKRLRAVPRELYQAELGALVALPPFVPDVYALESRIVDVEGYVSFDAHRYSVPTTLIGRRVEVRGYLREVRVFDGKREVACHRRAPFGDTGQTTLPAHRPPRGARKPPPMLPEEAVVRRAAPELAALCDQLKAYRHSRTLAIRRLHRLYMEYPLEPLVGAVGRALAHGLVDLERIETMVLRALAKEVFRLPVQPDEEETDGRQSGPAAQEPQARTDQGDPRRRTEEGHQE
jgi:hypothetical protein